MKTKRLVDSLSIIAALLSIIFLVSCDTTTPPASTAPIQTALPASATLLPPTFTALSLTPAPTETPALSTDTSLPTPTETPSILALAPTLAAQGESQMVKELLHTNDGCKLPF